MKFLSYFLLVVALAMVLVPSAVKADGWTENSCSSTVSGEIGTTGKVGSTASVTIDGGSRNVDGPYRILWSKTTITEDCENTGNCVLLTTGTVPTGETKVTVSFTIPEACYGTSYVQFLRGWRPESPYGFSFSVVPDIKVSPTSGSPGAEVTVNGTGFPGKKDVKLSFDGTDTNLEITASELGSFEAGFAVPYTISGKHELKATVKNMSLGDIVASLNIGPTISLEPKHPDIGAEVTLTGRGFAAKSQVSIKYDETSIADSPTTDDSGNFSHKFTVPESSEANHVITATDKAGNVATYGLPLESEAPPTPNTIAPGENQHRFGTFGAQLVTFAWTDVADPSGVTYILEIDNNLSFFPLEPGMRKTGLTKPGCTIKLEPGTYYWRVKAVDGAGNESDWALSPYPFQVGLFSTWYLVIGGLIFAAIFTLVVRAFFRRVREYYK